MRMICSQLIMESSLVLAGLWLYLTGIVLSRWHRISTMEKDMHRFAIVALILILFAAQGMAGFEIKKGVYTLDQLYAAEEKAAAEGKPLAFILTDKNTKNAPCKEASQKVMDALRLKCVLVYADAQNGDGQRLPAVVQAAAQSPQAGKFIPITIIADAAATNVIAIVPCSLGKEQDAALKEAKRKIQKTMPAAGPATGAAMSEKRPSAPAAQVDEKQEPRAWQLIGKPEFTALLVKVAGEYVILKKADGSQLQVRQSDLSRDDREYLAALPNSASKPAGSNAVSGAQAVRGAQQP
jgi:hypothetical protein